MTRKPAMPAKTLKALKASIEKWRKNENGEYQGIYSNACPLCKLFCCDENPSVRIEDDCLGCPVAAKTGQSGCRGSPWEDAWRAQADIKSKKFLAAAKAERIFLESLLPKEARK